MSIGNRIRFEVLKRDGFACHYCGARAPVARLEVDHIHPVSAGGPDDLDNLITACFRCNRGKFTAEVLDRHVPLDEHVAYLFSKQHDAVAMLAQRQEDIDYVLDALESGAGRHKLPLYMRIVVA